MYKLIICDDEELIREYLCELIEWEDLNFTLIDSFDDGLGAIEYLKYNHVDVILTDIRMGDVSGIDIAKYVYENNLDSKVILISGYQDFEYAKSAIKYNVRDYLVKPTTYTEVYDLFVSIKNELSAAHKNESSTVLRNQAFFDLLTGGYSNIETAEESLNLCGINLSLTSSIFSVFEIELLHLDDFLENKYKHGKAGVFNTISNILEENYGNNFYNIVKIENSVFQILCISDKYDSTSFSESLQKSISIIQENIKSVLSLDTRAAISYITTNAKELTRRFILVDNFDNHTINVFINEIIQYIYEDNKSSAIQLINTVTNTINDLSDINAFAETLLKKLNISFSPLPSKNGICDFIINAISNINPQNEDLVNKIKAFINENYNKDISLDDVAYEVNLNAAYLSRFFKEKTGAKFIDFLTELRIANAKKLLSDSNLKVYEICETVGYKSIHHFYKIFKKQEGCTPSEYRNDIS